MTTFDKLSIVVQVNRKKLIEVINSSQKESPGLCQNLIWKAKKKGHKDEDDVRLFLEVR